MNILRTALLVALLVLALGFCVFWWRALQSCGRRSHGWPGPIDCGIGFITDFLDTLGIGSFATTAALFRFTRRVPDRELPGTLNVGHALPTVLQAVIYISAIEIDVITLLTMIGASMLGAYVGAGFVARWSERRVRLAVGCALLIAAALSFAQIRGLMPGGGAARGLYGAQLALGIAGNLLLGVLMTMGIGLYAPCMLLVSLLGADPKAAFPIMMGSCAFLMLTAGPRFVRSDSYAVKPALGLALGGLPGVYLAAEIVKELALGTVRWLVLAVALYTALSLLWAARKGTVARAGRDESSSAPT